MLPYLHLLPLPTPFPVGPVNVYLADAPGEPLTLIDTGPKDDDSRAALEAGLAAHGRRIENIRRLILTHHHVDHIGLAREIHERSGAVILTHPFNVPWLVDYGAERERNRPFYLRIWEEGGVPADIIHEIDTSSGGVMRWLDPLEPDWIKTLDEGDCLRLAGHEWEVFHTPGHAGGLICLWEPETRTLLSNDHLIRDISSNPTIEPPPLGNGPRPRRLVEYIHQMQRMAALKPARALPGHGEIVDDPVGLVRKRIAFHRRRADKIHGILASNGLLTLWQLTQPIFPRLRTGMDYFLGLSEILGHLDLLQQAGRVEGILEDSVVSWATTDGQR